MNRCPMKGSPGSPGITIPGSLPAIILTLLFIAPMGCAGLRGMALQRDPNANTKCVLGQNPTLEEVVAVVNANVDKIQSWKADNVKISANNGGISMPVSGHLYVEREHRLRLEVTSIAGKEVDFGSNDEIFWIWSRRGNGPNPPVYYASHNDLDLAQKQFPIPFEPKWLMEALSIAPLTTENVRMDSAPGIAEIVLTSDHVLPSGQPVRKIVKVDSCRGRVIEHSTYDANNHPLVRVRMSDHRLDKNTGALLPRYVKLDWPQQEMSMEMNLGMIEVNPTSIPSAVWQPEIKGAPMVNLGGPPGRRPRATVTADQSPARSRTALVSPEQVSPIRAIEEEDPLADAPEFELPQMDRRTSSGVQLQEPEFATPYDAEAPSGRAKLNDWPEPSEFSPP